MKHTLFSTVLALGSLTAVGAVAQTPDASAAPQQQHARHLHNPHKQAMHLGKKLGLSSDQTARLEPILAQRRDGIMAIRQNTALTPDQKREQMHALKQSTHQQISGVLSPDQMQQWKAMRHHRKEHQQTAPTGV